ncbi:hypothetical protein RP20_CCG014284 [Aedes albopictus]|nr:hypothetical protein RP20_CCG014284 [Aedes albopictus]
MSRRRRVLVFFSAPRPHSHFKMDSLLQNYNSDDELEDQQDFPPDRETSTGRKKPPAAAVATKATTTDSHDAKKRKHGQLKEEDSRRTSLKDKSGGKHSKKVNVSSGDEVLVVVSNLLELLPFKCGLVSGNYLSMRMSATL